jgi:hypothetical protein
MGYLGKADIQGEGEKRKQGRTRSMQVHNAGGSEFESRNLPHVNARAVALFGTKF